MFLQWFPEPFYQRRVHNPHRHKSSRFILLNLWQNLWNYWKFWQRAHLLLFAQRSTTREEKKVKRDSLDCDQEYFSPMFPHCVINWRNFSNWCRKSILYGYIPTVGLHGQIWFFFFNSRNFWNVANIWLQCELFAAPNWPKCATEQLVSSQAAKQWTQRNMYFALSAQQKLCIVSAV